MDNDCKYESTNKTQKQKKENSSRLLAPLVEKGRNIRSNSLNTNISRKSNGVNSIIYENAEHDTDIPQMNTDKDTDNEIIDRYTEKQYNNFGWVRANNVLTSAEYQHFNNSFSDNKNLGFKFTKNPTTKETIIPTGDNANLLNVLVYTKGTFKNPIITKVVRTNSNDTTDVSMIRSEILDRETQGYRNAYEFVGAYAVEKVFSKYERQDYDSLQEFKRRRKGNVSKKDYSDSGTGENRTRSVETNSADSKAGLNNNSAFSVGEDTDGQYYKVTLSIGHNGNTATVYNVGKIKKRQSIARNKISVGSSNISAHGALSNTNISRKSNGVNSIISENAENDTDIQQMNTGEETDNEIVDRYTEKQYNNFGWVRANNVLTSAEYQHFTHEFANYKKLDNQPCGYNPVTKEAIIRTGDDLNTLNVFVYARGNIDNPEIIKIVRFNTTDKTELNIIKEGYLYADSRETENSYENVQKVFGNEFATVINRQDLQSFYEYQRGKQRSVSTENSGYSKFDKGRKNNRTENNETEAGLNKSAFSIDEDTDIRYMLSEDADSEIVDRYTEKQYNNYGWIAVNEVLTKNEWSQYNNKLRETLSSKIPRNINGEHVMTVGEHSSDITALVYVKGTAVKSYCYKCK